MQKKRKRRVVKAPSAPARDKMVKVAVRKTMCDACLELYKRGFDVCPRCGRERDGGTAPAKSRYNSENGIKLEA